MPLRSYKYLKQKLTETSLKKVLNFFKYKFLKNEIFEKKVNYSGVDFRIPSEKILWRGMIFREDK